MGNITFKMVKKLYENQGKIKNEEKNVENETKMNETSADHYLRCIHGMKTGQEYKMSVPKDDTLYFLSQIYKDDKNVYYKNALKALDKHINYRSYILEDKSTVEELYLMLKNKKINIDGIKSWYEKNNEYYPLKNIKFNDGNWTSRSKIIFPLEKAYIYLNEKEHNKICEKAKKFCLQGKQKCGETAFRSGYIISFMEDNDLLKDFLNKHWNEEGNSDFRKNNIEFCKEFYKQIKNDGDYISSDIIIENSKKKKSSTRSKKKDYKEKDVLFEKWLIKVDKKIPSTASQYKNKIHEISEHLSNIEGRKINIYEIGDISFIDEIVKLYRKNGKYEEFGKRGKSGNDNRHCNAAIKKYAEYFIYKNNKTQENSIESIPKCTVTVRPKSILNKKQKEHSQENDNDLISSKSYDTIYKKVEKLIHKINEYGKKGERGKLIFKESGMLGLLMEIRKFCNSRESFMSFILSLYILFKEKTRDKNPNYRNKNDHFYIYRFPEIFWEKDKITKLNFDNISIIRSEYSHSDNDDYKQKKQDKTFFDVIEELTGRKNNIPETIEEFQELQIKIMEQFVKALEELLQMVKDDL